MSTFLTTLDYQNICSRYPTSPSYEQFVEMFTEFAFYEAHAQKNTLRSSFNWEYVMPRMARSSVKQYCRRAGMLLPQDYPGIVVDKLTSLYDHHGIGTAPHRMTTA